MTESVLELSKLNVTFDTAEGPIEAVKGVSLAVAKGECLAVLGPGGAGKTQTLLAAFGLLDRNGRADGSVIFENAEILGAPRKELDAIRGRRVGFVFPNGAFAPHLTLQAQLSEVVTRHFRIRGMSAERHALEWLERVRIADAPRRLKQYPRELSAPLRQRVALAMAMICQPALLVADAPTADLDATEQAPLLDLIDELRADTETAVVLLTDDVGVAARVGQRIALMRGGTVVEQGEIASVFANPQSEMGRSLFKAAPRLAGARAFALSPPGEGPPVLDVDDVRVSFPVRAAGKARRLRAVDGVSFALRAGETLGVVGESGSGKSSLARAVVQLLPREAGSVSFLGRPLLPSARANIRAARRDLQMVFQDAATSLDPHLSLGAAIAEPLAIQERGLDPHEREARVTALMVQVGLEPALVGRFPRELSLEQRQRAGLARALILKPKLVVCDEALSALDVASQAHLLELLADLQRAHGASMLFLSRNLAAVRAVSHNVLVLYLGRAVEYGPTDTVFGAPRHPYTRALLSVALPPDPAASHVRDVVAVTDPPDALDSRAGLRFLRSRLIDDPGVVQYRPRWIEAAPGHFIAEHDADATA